MDVEKIIELFRLAKSKDWKPWELQSELRKLCENVVSVGDDLSFTIKFERDLEVDETAIMKLKTRKTKIYPFKTAYRFNKGYIAVDDRFLRVSREIDEDKLPYILSCIKIKE
ncbi:hypothetical protein DRP07_05065 [Archaeoglobales archaeon]|nr:MAG: hypothetical protein DRP07_05065 [Archaeoglobales archaeon]